MVNREKVSLNIYKSPSCNAGSTMLPVYDFQWTNTSRPDAGDEWKPKIMDSAPNFAQQGLFCPGHTVHAFRFLSS